MPLHKLLLSLWTGLGVFLVILLALKKHRVKTHRLLTATLIAMATVVLFSAAFVLENYKTQP